MVDWDCKYLCYNYDEKYVKFHRYHEQNLFHIDVSSTPLVEGFDQEEPSKEEGMDQPFPVP